jgi:polyphosphate kinase 2 (PPK2 family)
MKIDATEFRVPADEMVDLKKWPTLVKPVYKSKKHYHKILQRDVEQLSALQRLHYVSNRYAVLLILQAMDTAVKDGAIRNVMSGVNPQGCHVLSFKHPSAAEQEHDFLWRTSRDLPERGRIGIFNAPPRLPGVWSSTSLAKRRETYLLWARNRSWTIRRLTARARALAPSL